MRCVKYPIRHVACKTVSIPGRQGTSYTYLMTGGVKSPLVVSHVMFPVDFNELRGPFVYCIFNEIISMR